jgi:DNA-binding transcriptional LysR family regulator
MPVNIPITALRSFVAIVNNGSMLSASEKVFVTQSALSLQIKRLEEIIQQPLFRRDGRKLTLTQTGESFLSYARRVLVIHDEGLTAIREREFTGPVRVGMVQDFADIMLTQLLGRFADLHPDVPIFARVGRTAELQTMLQRGLLDLAIGFGGPQHRDALCVSPMTWHGDDTLLDRPVLPLVVLETPCRFRDAAIARLDSVGRPWQIAVETPDLSTLYAAVRARLGVTCRTDMFTLNLPVVPGANLPTLPEVACVIEIAKPLSKAAVRFFELSAEAIRALRVRTDHLPYV